MIRRRYSAVSVLLVALLSVSIYGCGKKDEKAAETQVVARVNGDEISIHQVNFQLSQLGQLSEAQGKEAGKEIVKRLIDQQLLVEKATEAKLDRDPGVVLAMESVKREILAKAYLERQMAQAAKPSAKEIDDFYNQHPELFEKRRVYRLQELAVQVDKSKAAELMEAAKTAKGLTDLAQWLKSRNYPFSANANVGAAEQLPKDLLAQLQKMKDGDMVVVPRGNAVNVVQIAASQEQPIPRDKASGAIEQYFLNQHRADLVKKEMDRLHAEAKIEYFGKFANLKTAPVADAKPQSATDAPQAASKQQNADANHIDKGLAGL